MYMHRHYAHDISRDVVRIRTISRDVVRIPAISKQAYIYISVYKCTFPDFKKLESGCFVIARICTISRDVVRILAIEKEASQL